MNTNATKTAVEIAQDLCERMRRAMPEGYRVVTIGHVGPDAINIIAGSLAMHMDANGVLFVPAGPARQGSAYHVPGRAFKMSGPMAPPNPFPRVIRHLKKWIEYAANYHLATSTIQTGSTAPAAAPYVPTDADKAAAANRRLRSLMASVERAMLGEELPLPLRRAIGELSAEISRR